MSNNAIYDCSPYHVVGVQGHQVELEPVDEAGGPALWVDVMAPTLIIDPTDDEWAAARRPT
jgi:hypothetical protein